MPICHDVDRSVAEIEWLADKPGIRGVMIPTMWRDRTPYNDPSYDPVWAACQAASFPVHTHSGEAPREEMNDFIGIYLAEVVFWTHRPIAHLLFSGAFERFPNLKFVVTEGACYWVPDMKWKWDQYFGGGHTTKKMAALMKGIISKLPSEYFGENIFVGASTMSKEEIRRRHAIGCDVAMWGTDYPHPEGTWPNTIERLRSDFGDVPVGDTRQLLGETAARCYGFDIESLRPFAEQIGPTPDDLGQDPSLVTTADERPPGRVVEGRVPREVGRLAPVRPPRRAAPGCSRSPGRADRRARGARVRPCTASSAACGRELEHVHLERRVRRRFDRPHPLHHARTVRRRAAASTWSSYSTRSASFPGIAVRSTHSVRATPAR